MGDTHAHETQTVVHMLTRVRGSAWDSLHGQMLVCNTANADLVTRGHSACGPEGSYFFCPVFQSIHLLTISLPESPKRQGHCMLGFLATRPLAPVTTSAMCMVTLTQEKRGASRGLSYKKPTLLLPSLDQKHGTQMLARSLALPA